MATVYIIYNADASLRGKFNYVCRKLSTSSTEDPACAACELTHNGLRLTETAQWASTKGRIGAEVKQLHRDELSDELKDFISTEKIRLPVILARDNTTSPLKAVMDRDELKTCSKTHYLFLEMLEKNLGEAGVAIGIKPKPRAGSEASFMGHGGMHL